jgi:hypothetical protein
LIEDSKKQQFVLEKYANKELKSIGIVIIIGIFMPPLIIVFAIIYAVYNNWFKEIQHLRDNYNEIDLLAIINSKSRNQKYFFALCALVDLGNMQIKQIIVNEIFRLDQKIQNDFINSYKSKLATILAILLKKEENIQIQ